MHNGVSVVIPYYNHYNLLHQVLFDLYTYCRSSVDEIVTVNDGSTETESYQGLAWWKKQNMLPIRILEMEENVGFLRASNAGMRCAIGDYVILLSNDVRVQENIIPRIVHSLEGNQKCLVGGKLYNFDTGWNTFNGKVCPYLEGWLLATKKSLWEEIGYFDERYAPNDMEDVDASTTAIDKGFTLVSLEGAKISHIGGASINFSPEREALTIRNKEKFRQKWIK